MKQFCISYWSRIGADWQFHMKYYLSECLLDALKSFVDSLEESTGLCEIHRAYEVKPCSTS